MEAQTSEIGVRIRAWRMAKGLTYEQAARAIGMTMAGLWKIEKGERRNPRRATRQKIEAAINGDSTDV